MQQTVKNHAMPHGQTMAHQHDYVAMCGSTLTQLYHWSGFGAMDSAVLTWSPWSPTKVSNSFLLEESSFAVQFCMCTFDEALTNLAGAVSIACELLTEPCSCSQYGKAEASAA